MNIQDLQVYKLLSFKQKYLVRKAEILGFITLDDVFSVYNSETNGINAIDRLIRLKIIRPRLNCDTVWDYLGIPTFSEIFGDKEEE